ncbi:hypothetical protein [Dyella amyloliquefaciens]|uniref:hypothetical protein n=1 Tax=Dyella amyloliquefaciens TaxID=1770545 RepID=UPI00102EB5B7|nr:hypothetical protein [Dyella amyloliquefaciens]
MATHDHTVRIRPSVSPGGILTPPSGDPPRTGVAGPETFRRTARGDIALALLTLTRLRHDSEQCRRARARGFPGTSLEWPLSTAATASLGVAIHGLRQYASLLGHEPRVKPPSAR